MTMTDDMRAPPDGADPWEGLGPFLDTRTQGAGNGAALSAEERRALYEIRQRERLQEETDRELLRLRARHAAEEQFKAELAEKAKADVTKSSRVHDGASFLLDLPPTPPAIWGEGDNILWPRGESLIIAGPQGVGKTTIAGQLLRGLAGIQPQVLGFPVEPVKGRIGYLAMDRPEQARRALGRMFCEADRDFIAEVIRFWSGPLPTDAAVDEATFVRIAERLDTETLMVDSVKDAAIGLSKDEVGAGYNRARQFALAEGIQMSELHHVVKNGADGKAPRNLAGIFGSTWITTGAGSVIMLWGEAGDPIVEFTHLKQPINEVGPFKIRHDRDTGLSEVFHDEETDVIKLARRCATSGLSAHEAAGCMFGTEKATTAQVEKARRRLAKFVADGLLVERGGGKGRGSSARWFAAAPAGWGHDPEEPS